MCRWNIRGNLNAEALKKCVSTFLWDNIRLKTILTKYILAWTNEILYLELEGFQSKLH